MNKWKQRELEFRLYVPAGDIFSMKEDKHFTSIDNWQDRQEESETSLVLLNGFTVQYTGVKDVNGKKIFEADICRFQLDFNYDFEKGFIVYNKGQICLKVRVEGNPYYFIGKLKNIKVLGNVFQNPELVEKYKLEI